ncbi:hypothetical protein Hanom_Chr03g00182111 [Helianthus anomalus]
MVKRSRNLCLEGSSKIGGRNSIRNGVSFLDILTNRTRVEDDDDVLKLDPAIFSLSSLSGRAVVGRSLGLYELRTLKSSLRLAGFVDASVQYLGGLSVLISFENGDLAESFLRDRGIWSRWFSSLSRWLGQPLPYERLAWVNILGVPPHLVSSSVFDLIGSKYGKTVQPSQFSESDRDLSFDRLGILIDSGNRINGFINLSWQDKRYKVWVIEDNDQWVPDFFEVDEESVAASSELGGSPDIRVNVESSVKEFEQIGAGSKVEGEKSWDHVEPSNNMHVPMHSEKNGGDSIPKEAGEKVSNNVGHVPISSPQVNHNFFHGGEMDNSNPIKFFIGKPNTDKPNLFKRPASKKYHIRSIIREATASSSPVDSRPKKRPRANLEGERGSGEQVYPRGSGAIC